MNHFVTFNTNIIVRRIFHAFALLIIVLVTNDYVRIVEGQVVGTEICACQPSVYNLILNLSATCPETTVNGTIPGIMDAACQVESRDQTENATEVPQTVSSVIVSELDANLLPIFQAVYRDGPYVTGDIITYTSIVVTDPDEINAATLPRAFQVVLTGLNSEEETLTNTYIITYDNDCGIFPLLTKGEQIGWTIFGDLGNPPQDLCPVAPGLPPSDQPSASPSAQPNVSPSAMPFMISDAPTTFGPTISPTFGPTTVATQITESPSTSPSASPNASPSTVPSDSPSFRPSTFGVPITSSPITLSSDAPSDSPSDSPSETPSEAPTKGRLTPTCPPIGGNKPRSNGDSIKSPSKPTNNKDDDDNDNKPKRNKKNKRDNHHVGLKEEDRRHRNRELRVGRRPSPSPTQCPEEELDALPRSRSDDDPLPRKKKDRSNNNDDPKHGEMKRKGDQNVITKNITKKKQKSKDLKDQKDPSNFDRNYDADMETLT